MMALPFGNISLFNISYSMDIRPGPVIKRLTSMAINNDSNSYPPTNPSGSFTRTIAPIMSIIRSIADILVTIPRIRNIPPTTSNKPVGRASSGGSPMLPKKP
jgi:hypothetical protein